MRRRLLLALLLLMSLSACSNSVTAEQYAKQKAAEHNADIAERASRGDTANLTIRAQNGELFYEFHQFEMRNKSDTDINIISRRNNRGLRKQQCIALLQDKAAPQGFTERYQFFDENDLLIDEVIVNHELCAEFQTLISQ